MGNVTSILGCTILNLNIPFVTRQTVIFQKPDGSPLVLYATHAKKLLQLKFEIILEEMHRLFPGELDPVDSTSEGYSFLALHFGYYNRYAENVSLQLLQHWRTYRLQFPGPWRRRTSGGSRG